MHLPADWLRRAIIPALLLLAASALAQRGPQDNFVHEPDLGIRTLGPSGPALGDAVDVAVETTNIYVTDVEADRVLVYDKQENLLFTVGANGSTSNKLKDPGGLVVDENRIFIADTGNNRISVWNKSGNWITNWGGAGTNVMQFDVPNDIAADGTNLYVADCDNSRIQVLTKNGAFVRAWGEPGSLSGQFCKPVGLAVDDTSVYVIDLCNSRIQVFLKDGSFVRSWPLPLTYSWNANASHSACIAVDRRTVYLAMAQIPAAQSGHHVRLFVYDKLGTVVWSWSNEGAGQLSWPSGIAVDNPFLQVADRSLNRIVTYRRIFRTLGGITNDPIPLAEVMTVDQRPGTQILDVDYALSDENDPALTVYAGAFRLSTNTAPDLRDYFPMRTFVDGTAAAMGPAIPTDGVHRLSWDMNADGAAAALGDYGQVKVAILAKDTRDLLDLHFLSLPNVGTNPAVTINRVPLQQADLLPVWFWWLAAGDTNLALATGTVSGVNAPYAGVPLAQGTNTTDAGRAFLFARLNLREATPAEVTFAREGLTPGQVTLDSPRRQPPPAGYKVNEFNFVTSPTNGWWVVPLP